MRIILLCMVFIFGIFYAAKADYRVSVVDIMNPETKEMKRVLHLAGAIEEGITEDTKYLLDKYKVDNVVLYSEGGLAAEGYELGWLFSDRLSNTYISRGTYCLSACAIAFLGGTNYKINGGILGFHKGHLNKTEPFENQEEAFDTGQIVGSYSLSYILNNGFSYWLDRKVNDLTSPTAFLSFTSEEELNKFYVRNEENNLNTYFEKIDAGSIMTGEDMLKHLEDNPHVPTWKLIQVVETKEKINEISK